MDERLLNASSSGDVDAAREALDSGAVVTYADQVQTHTQNSTARPRLGFALLAQRAPSGASERRPQRGRHLCRTR